MNRRIVVRRATLGALAAGLVPLAAAGSAGAAPDNSPALCRSSVGDRGPTGGPIVGEAPPGDPMVVSVGWDPGDWTEGRLGRIVTCVGVDDHAAAWMTNTVVSPPNTGSLTLNLTLPDGGPGALVCEQSLLVGDKGAAGRTRTTSPVCFKLRAPEPASPPPGRSGHRQADGPGGPGPASATTPAIRPAPAVHAPTPPGPAPAPAPDPASTPPARGAFEARRPTAGRGPAPMVDELPRSGAAIPAAPVATSAPAPVATPGAARVRRTASAVGARTAAGTGTPAGAAAGAPVTALPRTGLENKIPLAGAGGLLALGGFSIMFGSPRRRRTT